jgi:uncharacterized Ntn-hydrolase superfamily protein
MLAGEAVVADTLAAFLAGPVNNLPTRLLGAMEAGQAAGGDRRGQQSAAMLLTTTEDFPDLNIRVDDSREPLAELSRLLTVWRRDRAPGLRTAPRKADPAGQTNLDSLEAPWIAAGLEIRFRR